MTDKGVCLLSLWVGSWEDLLTKIGCREGLIPLFHKYTPTWNWHSPEQPFMCHHQQQSKSTVCGYSFFISPPPLVPSDINLNLLPLALPPTPTPPHSNSPQLSRGQRQLKFKYLRPHPMSPRHLTIVCPPDYFFTAISRQKGVEDLERRAWQFYCQIRLGLGSGQLDFCLMRFDKRGLTSVFFSS